MVVVGSYIVVVVVLVLLLRDEVVISVAQGLIVSSTKIFLTDLLRLMSNIVVFIIIMVRGRGLGRSGIIVVVARGVVRTLKMVTSFPMQVFNSRMVVVTLGTMATMLSLHLALNGKK